MNESTNNLLKAELNTILNIENPLDYRKTASHYKQYGDLQAAEIVDAISKHGFFAGTCAKYILRRHYKGQYESDVVKIMHTYRLAKWFANRQPVTEAEIKYYKSIFPFLDSHDDCLLLALLLHGVSSTDVYALLFSAGISDDVADFMFCEILCNDVDKTIPDIQPEFPVDETVKFEKGDFK